jgi:hypothetical protein
LRLYSFRLTTSIINPNQVKYRFQNPSSDLQYRSTLHALATITREERLRGLYKGIASPLVRGAVVLPTGNTPTSSASAELTCGLAALFLPLPVSTNNASQSNPSATAENRPPPRS